MPNINDMRETNYLSKNDVEPPAVLKITKCEQIDVSLDSEPEELKWILHFAGDYKPLILNWTNINLIAATLGSEETSDWIGKDITLFNDKSIMFKGKVTGGIRVYIPQQSLPTTQEMNKAAGQQIAEKPVSEPVQEPDEEIPF